eukprot:CAMPEP_0181330156 /NCGR_PEP_ID=MMETSP1101-20121128/23733_1 /TAXON_ID=46948 /ORGANISM="Rhodomonas abbreviata, Strain Caron Lab Isolate" /LENGTH=35 /DNA_ID= /DNA_START= /DNA_END= /DNA_ORIENTATION=
MAKGNAAKQDFEPIVYELGNLNGVAEGGGLKTASQ